MAAGVMDCSQSRWMGCLRLRVTDDVAENQFALAPGVAGVDELGHILALDELFEGPQAGFAPLNRLQIEVRRDDRQAFERPLAARGLDAFRRHDGEQWPTADEMTYCRFRSNLRVSETFRAPCEMSLATDGFSAMMSTLPICWAATLRRNFHLSTPARNCWK